MQKRHRNRRQYFDEQHITTEKYVIPYINSVKLITKDLNILEIGCGEGGNISPFLDKGYKCTGIDLSQSQINNAEEYFKDHPNRENLSLICNDIYDIAPEKKYDIILLRDVIEHIPNQNKFMGHLKQFVAKGGIIFFGFPPWQMPFGGHQQVLGNKIISKTPYIHLLPNFIYGRILRLAKIDDASIESRFFLKETGISIERFEKILKQQDYRINKRDYYLINPNYDIKFGLRPRKQSSIVKNIYYLRNYFTTAMYYVVSLN